MYDLSSTLKASLYVILLGVLSVTLMACDDNAKITGISGSPDERPGSDNSGPACRSLPMEMALEHALAQVGDVRRTAEAHLHRFNDKVPGFGGMYRDEHGYLHAFVKNPNEESMVKSILSVPQGLSDAEDFAANGLVIHKGTYSFRELAAWRELVTAFVLAGTAFDQVLASEVDETSNRIRIGIDRERYTEFEKEEVLHFVTTRLQIPEEAIIFGLEDAEQVWNQSKTIEKTNSNFIELKGLEGDIQVWQRPLVGGLRISYGSSNCSLGFLGLYEDKDVFVTNGHCTDEPHHSGRTIYYQGERGEPDHVAGVELLDGPQSLDHCVVQNADCWPCRWSDAAIVEIAQNAERARGLIARTTYPSQDWMTDGSRLIDGESPVFAIADSLMELLHGDVVHKMGGNSGWTSGQIIRTCVDSRRSRHELILQCQYRARYASSGGGTSGSPVFKMLDPESLEKWTADWHPVTLAGIHRGSSNRDQPNGYTVFSPLSGVMADFPGLNGLAAPLP